jgi:hypothetical protein
MLRPFAIDHLFCYQTNSFNHVVTLHYQNLRSLSWLQHLLNPFKVPLTQVERVMSQDN